MTQTATANRQVVLARHPEGRMREEDFAIRSGPVPEPGDGQFLVRTLAASVDPMLRIFIDPSPLDGGMPAMPLGTVIPGAAVGRVIVSRHPGFPVDSLVEGRFGWQDYALSDGAGVNPVPAALGRPEIALGLGGLPGFTAFVGLEVAQLSPGQTVLVSGAAGGVGSALGLLAKERGLRAVGIAGGADKCRYLTEEAGYTAAADRNAPDFAEQLAHALPGGANAYIDNVGGPLMAAVIPHLARGAKVLISGLMGQYQDLGADPAPGPDNLPALLRAVMFRGVSVAAFSQYGRADLRPAFEAAVVRILKEGAATPLLQIEEGLEQIPAAQVRLFEQSRPGKVIVRIAQDETVTA